jgi:hypothetical protein
LVDTSVGGLLVPEGMVDTSVGGLLVPEGIVDTSVGGILVPEGMVDTSVGGLLVPESINALSLTWFIRCHFIEIYSSEIINLLLKLRFFTLRHR